MNKGVGGGFFFFPPPPPTPPPQPRGQESECIPRFLELPMNKGRAWTGWVLRGLGGYDEPDEMDPKKRGKKSFVPFDAEDPTFRDTE